MSGIDKYNDVFKTIFNVRESELTMLEYKQTAEWNSMAHIALVAQLEETFDVDFDMDDIYNLKSYQNGKKILAEKFGVEF